jgi:hypothetical protein
VAQALAATVAQVMAVAASHGICIDGLPFSGYLLDKSIFK